MKKSAERYVIGEERFALLDGLRMRYLVMGPTEAGPQKTPLVLIHGLLASAFSWRCNIQPFAAGRKVYAIDQLGIGYSERPKNGSFDYSFRSTAQRLLQWMKDEGLRGADVVATSHGGAIAMMMSALDVEQGTGLIGRQILVDAANPFSKHGNLRIVLFNTPVGSWFVRTVGVARVASGTFGLRRMYFNRDLCTDESELGYSTPMQIAGTEDYALGILKTWWRDMDDLREHLPRAAQRPTLLIWGANDNVVPVSSGRELAECFPNAELKIIPNCGHLPYEETPEEFNRIVLDYLDK
jgi:pimeloyl-ACP methyl ester carboxylesterase